MANPTSLDVLDSEIADLENALTTKKRVRAELAKLGGSNTIGGVRIDEHTFEGMKKVEATAKFLRMIKRSASLTEVKEALDRGGADLGKDPDRYTRNLRITVSMNSTKPSHPFVYDEANDTVSLKSQRQKA